MLIMSRGMQTALIVSRGVVPQIMLIMSREALGHLMMSRGQAEILSSIGVYPYYKE